MKPIVMDAGQQPTKANLFSAYTKRVRSNIHLVICMRYVCIMKCKCICIQCVCASVSVYMYVSQCVHIM